MENPGITLKIGNISKKQQPDQRSDNNQGLRIGLQHSENISQPDVVFRQPLNKIVY